MNGFITKKWATLSVALGMTLGSGCECYRNLVDPCYPQRYEYAARQEVKTDIAPQVNNGHVLDQTIWNFYFEPGSDKLTPAGLERIGYLTRRRPAPDPMVYLQTAQDIKYDPAAPEKYAQDRAALDTRRTQAVQGFLKAVTSGRDLTFEVVVHDPPVPDLAAAPASVALQKMYASFQGTLPSSGGAGSAGASGGAGASAGGGK